MPAKRKIRTKKPKKKPARRRRAAKSAAKSQTFSASAVVNELLQGNFKNVLSEVRHFEGKFQKQLLFFRNVADKKTQDIRAQIKIVRKDVSERLRKAARKDLKKVQGRIRDLATRVGRLEALLKEI